MGKPTGFKEFPRQPVAYRDVAERSRDYGEVYGTPDVEHLTTSGRPLHGLRRAVLSVRAAVVRSTT